MDTLKKRLEEELFELYCRIKEEAGYNPNYFLQMLNTYGGYETAKRLLSDPDKLHEGFIKLWSLGRLDLTVEHLVLQDPWRRLFMKEGQRKGKIEKNLTTKDKVYKFLRINEP